MTAEVPLVAGDVLRAVDTPVVSPPSGSPTAVALNAGSSGGAKSKGHRRTSSAASDIAKAAGIDLEAVSMGESKSNSDWCSPTRAGLLARSIQYVESKC